MQVNSGTGDDGFALGCCHPCLCMPNVKSKINEYLKIWLRSSQLKEYRIRSSNNSIKVNSNVILVEPKEAIFSLLKKKKKKKT